MFELFARVDKKFASNVNEHMCTNVCMCNGKAGDEWYDDYKKLDDRLAESDRQFSKPNDYEKGEDPVPLSWTNGNKDRESFQIESMHDCLENFDKKQIAEKRALYDKKTYLAAHPGATT